jgi:hypothetical protein
MYTVEIDISDWNNTDSITIVTDDFDKVQIIQEFVEMQVEAGWTANYVIDMIDDDEEFDDEDDEDDEEDEPSTISTHIITTIDDNDPSKSSTVIVTTEG